MKKAQEQNIFIPEQWTAWETIDGTKYIVYASKADGSEIILKNMRSGMAYQVFGLNICKAGYIRWSSRIPVYC